MTDPSLLLLPFSGVRDARLEIMTPIWLWWGFFPGTISVAWYFAWQITETSKYAFFATGYALLYFAGLVLLLAALLLGVAAVPAGTVLLVFSLLFFLGTWIGGIGHLRREQEEIQFRRKYSTASRTFDMKPPLTLEDRIKLEYGFIPDRLSPPPPSKPRSTRATKREEELFSEISILLGEQGYPSPPRQRPQTPFLPSFPPLVLPTEHQASSSPVPLPVGKIDLNRADRDSLAAIPQLGTTLALEIVRHREEFGPFVSFDDFCARLSLKPHVRVALEQRVEICASEVGPPSKRNSKGRFGRGRRVD